MTLRYGITLAVLLGTVSVAAAGPLVPPSDLPGRERYRFEPSPLDRFMQPRPPARPLLRWDCEPRGAWRNTPRSRRNPNC